MNRAALLHWSCEQHESNSDDAWGQNFYYGGQSHWSKDSNERARAVRRVDI